MKKSLLFKATFMVLLASANCGAKAQGYVDAAAIDLTP